MNLARVDAIVRAVLYEGYILYPYRSSSVKNRQRWTFGGIYPRGYEAMDKTSAATMRTQCLLRDDGCAAVEVHVRFLHLLKRDIGKLVEPAMELPTEGEPAYSKVAFLQIGERRFQEWEEAVERDVTASALSVASLSERPARIPFSFPGQRVLEPICETDGLVVGTLIRGSAAIEGEIVIAAQQVMPSIFQLTVRIDNLTPCQAAEADMRDAAQQRAFASTHTILGITGGAFISLLDPPESLAAAAAGCDNQGTWPVLAGEEGETDIVLSSPIILYDHPQVAPESPGDLFDGTEIDEILTLRILAMTDEEKREMLATDERARAVLERTEALTAADMQRLHGTMRNPRFGMGPDDRMPKGERAQGGNQAVVGQAVVGQAMVGQGLAGPQLAYLNTGGVDLKVGDRVRLRPKPGGDVMDLVLKDEIAIIEAIERDFEDRIHVAVVIEADPGREFGFERMPGHRFFFSPEELEALGAEEQA
jgi:hydrogenase maturation protease